MNTTVVTVVVPDEVAAERLLRSLTAAPDVDIVAGAVVSRSSDGGPAVTDRIGEGPAPSPPPPEPHPAAVAIGVVVASLDGLLLGNSLLSMAGAAGTAVQDDERALLAEDVPRGGSAVVALVVEADPRPVDELARAAGGIARRHRYVVAVDRSTVDRDTIR